MSKFAKNPGLLSRGFLLYSVIMKNKILALIILTSFSVQVFAANLYSPKQTVDYDQVTITLSSSLYDLVNFDILDVAINQINSLPEGIPKVLNIVEEQGEPMQDKFTHKLGKVFELAAKTKDTNVFQVHIAYEPDEDYSIGNSVAKVWATNAGLILINDIRLKQVSGILIDPTYLVNVIIHELMHIYGLNHASIDIKLNNGPVMNLGKFGYIGLAHDDIAGLLENYDIDLKTRKELTIQTTGSVAVVQSLKKRRRAQGKRIEDGVVVFPQLIRDKYKVFIDGEPVGKVRVNKNKEIVIPE